jgi:hypothetical protein
MPEPPSYLRRFVTRASHETALFTYRKLLIGFLMGLISRIALLRLGKVTITWADVWRDLLIFSGAYSAVVLVSFLLNLIRTPALLDRERADEIAALSKENDTLKQKQTVPEVSAQERRRRDFVSAEIRKLGEVGRKILRYIDDQGHVNAMAVKLDSKFNENAVSAFLAMAIPSGLISYANHVMSIKPELKSAVEFVFSTEYDQDMKD